LTVLRQATNAPERVLARADSQRLVSSAEGTADITSDDVLDGGDDDTERLDVVAAVLHSFVWLSEHDDELVNQIHGWYSDDMDPPTYDVDTFITTANDLLLGARVGWHFQDGRFEPRDNQVLHAEVVEPAAVLLDSDPKFAPASRGFQTALNRLAENKPDVAITDAASAVQEFFRALGVVGNSIADQLNNAQKASLITSYDRQLLKPIIDWMNSDRSDRGNAHHHRDGEVPRADAWLAIHVAGALMVRLSNKEPRQILAARAKKEKEAAEQARVRRAAELAKPSSPLDDSTPF